MRRQVAAPASSPAAESSSARSLLSARALAPYRLSIKFAARQISISGITSDQLGDRAPALLRQRQRDNYGTGDEQPCEIVLLGWRAACCCSFAAVLMARTQMPNVRRK